MKESSIVARISKRLRADGAFVVKIHGSNLQLDGLPDLMGTFRGRGFGIEVKVPGEDATALQRWVLGEMAKAGALTGVAHSLDEALEILKEMYVQ